MMRRRWVIAPGAVVAAGVIVWAVWAWRGGRIQEMLGLRESPHPTDEWLMANFSRHRAAFEQVVALLREHPELVRGAAPQPRNVEYRDLLQTLGVHEVAVSADGNRIELTVSGRGFVTHNSQKGYLYSADPVRDDVRSELDSVSQRGVGSAVRKLDEHWYLFFEGY